MTLGALPAGYVRTRQALHQIAFFAIAPSRYQATGRMGLEARPGGFGTPEFEGRVARVEGDLLVLETEDTAATQSITTVRAAAEFFGVSYQVDWFDGFHDPLPPSDPDAPLAVDLDANLALGEWFAFGFEVLSGLRRLGPEWADATDVQLWPEHFDPAIELGDPETGRRASFGASPGDAANPEPYIYVAPWSEIDRSHVYWNAHSFGGAKLDHAELAASDDPVGRALEFLVAGHRAIHSH